jgi:hypothetical protein
LRDGRVPFACGKHRRTEAPAPIVLQILGDKCSVVDASRNWVFDERTRSIAHVNDRPRFRVVANA